MSERVAILLKAFEDIPTGEWLEELAVRELDKYTAPSNGALHNQHGNKITFQCTHCGKPSASHMGASRHHKMIHVNRRSDYGIQTPIEGECIRNVQ